LAPNLLSEATSGRRYCSFVFVERRVLRFTKASCYF
jgi:hypothetical protein